MQISTELIKALRDETGVSVMECKKALEEAGGDHDKALQVLQTRSGAAAQKKAGRALGAGAVASYVHNTRTVAAMVLLSSETDFVAKNEAFIQLAYDIAMHVAATNPRYLSRGDLPDGAAAEEGELVLLEQPFIKDASRTIQNLIEGAIQKFGERVEITKFIRFSTND